MSLLASLADPARLWHGRLGHVNFYALKMMGEEMAIGLSKITHPNQVCESCLVSKQTRLLFPAQANFRAEHPLQLVHADLCGPITPPSLAGNKYFLLLVDDYSHWMWVYMLREKGGAFEAFKKFKRLVENKSEHKLKTLRTDRGGEFTSQKFAEFCKEEGVERHLTAPYTPQQNGVAERRNRTVMGTARSLLKSMQVSTNL